MNRRNEKELLVQTYIKQLERANIDKNLIARNSWVVRDFLNRFQLEWKENE